MILFFLAFWNTSPKAFCFPILPFFRPMPTILDNNHFKPPRLFSLTVRKMRGLQYIGARLQYIGAPKFYIQDSGKE